MRQKVCDLERRVRLSKANVEQIVTVMSVWSQTPLYQRKEDKKDCLLGLEVNYIYMHIHTYMYLSISVGAILTYNQWNFC